MILILGNHDRLDLAADLKLPAGQGRQVTGGGVRVVKRPSDPATHRPQLLKPRTLLGRLEDGRRALRLLGLLVRSHGAKGLACYHDASSGRWKKRKGGTR